ncbi:bile acid:sodium symporter [Desulfospira joergensenii]|uniref:bile acid:sodium symporter n=1 Tax=Desulfospira joergensenii TaxID=53329 RepID=UPI0003B2E6DE|nr:bile acid:sodium symporter [Desulfospira joergensenii]
MSTIKKQWFLAGLILVFAGVILDSSLTLARTGIFFKIHQGPPLMIFIIFFFSGLIIEPAQIRAGIRDIKATAAALGLIAGVAPVLAMLLLHLPLETGVAIGIILVAVMPTTLSSGVVMTGQAGGNMAHALFVTILSNCLSVISIPLILPRMVANLGLGADIVVDRKAILIKLVFLVLVPLVLGLLTKQKALPTVTPAWKRRLGMANQCIVLGIVFMSLSGAREVLISQTQAMAWILPLVAVFHAGLLGIAFLVTPLLGLGKGRRESVVFMGAQKTLPLAVIIQITCFPQFGTALLVCVVHHVLHLMMDGYLAGRMGEG